MKEITEYIYNPSCKITLVDKPFLLKNHTVKDIEKYAVDFAVWEANHAEVAKWRDEVKNVRMQLLRDFKCDCIEHFRKPGVHNLKQIEGAYNFVFEMVNDYCRNEDLDYILREVLEKYEKLMVVLEN